MNAKGGRDGDALQAASSKGDGESVKLLLENGANVDADGGEYGNALHAASVRGHTEMDGNALQGASFRGHIEIVKLMLEKCANINAQVQVQGVAPRDYFFDGPLPALAFSTTFGALRNETLNGIQMALLELQIATTHAKGIAVSYWDQPGWPVTTRNAVWRTLWNAGADLLKVDDVEAAADYWQGDTFTGRDE